MRSLFRTALGFGLLMGAVADLQVPAFAADSKNVPRPVRRDPRFASAQLEESRGHLDEAKRIYTAILQSEPGNAECCHKLGSIYAKLNRHAEAEVYYRQATALNPDNAQLLADRGFSALKRKDYFRAEEWLDKSIKLDAGKDLAANSKATLRNLAIARGWMNKDEQCLETFRRITDEAEALRSLAAIQIARGDASLGQRNMELAKGVGQLAAPIPDLLPPAPETFGSESISLLPPPAAAGTANVSRVNAATLDVAGTNVSMPALMTEPSPLADESVPLPPSAPPASIEMAQKPAQPRVVKHLRAAPAPLVPVIESKTDLLPTCGRPAASLAAQSVSVTSSAVDSSRDNERVASEVLPSVESSEPNFSENLVFERPIKSTSPTTVANDPPRLMEPAGELEAAAELPAQLEPETRVASSPREKPVPPREKAVPPSVPVVEDLRLDDVCLVTLKEKRQVTKGQSQFSCEFHGQKFQCASAEALTKFKANPSHFVPAAGGLDVVQFKKERDFSQGSLQFSTWYENRLFLFVNQKSCDEFKRDPLKYAPAE